AVTGRSRPPPRQPVSTHGHVTDGWPRRSLSDAFIQACWLSCDVSLSGQSGEEQPRRRLSRLDYDRSVSPRLRGREPQVEVLRGQLTALRAGRGSIVLVTGPAGAGKTTLLAAAASLAADRKVRVFCGGGDPGARAVPLGPVLDALLSADDPSVTPAR